jgi:hypothetical protein
MTAPLAGAAWATVDDVPESAVGMRSAVQWTALLGLATDVLWAATGRRWRGVGNTATVVLRAAAPRPGEAGWPYHSSWGHCGCYGGLTPALIPAWVTGWTGGHHEPAAVRLPHSDVTAVTSVTVAGSAFAAWRLDGAWLARTDGRGWAVCGDQTLVSYAYGLAPPEGGRMMVVELAVEMARSVADDPDRPCRLPARLTTVTRQGLTFAALDDLSFLEKGLTGLVPVDMWIRSVNPHLRSRRGSVWNPDVATARRT